MSFAMFASIISFVVSLLVGYWLIPIYGAAGAGGTLSCSVQSASGNGAFGALGFPLTASQASTTASLVTTAYRGAPITVPATTVKYRLRCTATVSTATLYWARIDYVTPNQ